MLPDPIPESGVWGTRLSLVLHGFYSTSSDLELYGFSGIKVITSIFFTVERILKNIGSNLSNLNCKINSVIETTMQFRAEVNNSISSLRENLTSLNDAISNFSITISNVNKGLQEHKKQTETELADLQTSLVSIQTNFTSQLDIKLEKYNQQMTAELTTLQTSLNSTHSKLDSLTATTAQLSSDHQQIQANISDVECLDTEQSLELHQDLQDNLTHQLEKIEDDITYLKIIHGPYTCGGTGGWRRVAHLDMTTPNTTCPSGWSMTGYSKRTCGRATDGTNTCDSATFPVGGEYNKICGKIRAYQWATTDGFKRHFPSTLVATIDNAYVDGVSVTHGTPRNHIWTFVAGITEGNPTAYNSCPCDSSINISVPSFVADDYFCESGINARWDRRKHHTFHSNDALWDGEDCLPSSTCCSRRNPPYFVKQLPTSTIDDIEARICLDEVASNENIAVELVELYVQ